MSQARRNFGPWLRRALVILSAAVIVPACKHKNDDGVPFVPTPGTLGFSAATFPGTETVGTATITVSRSGGTLGAVSIVYATSNGTATAGTDYTATGGTLIWVDGDGADKTFTVTIANDVAVEGDETVNLTLSLPSGGTSLGTSAATLIIQDNDTLPAGAVQFDAAASSVGEAAGSTTLFASRSGGSTGAVSVNYAVTGGTATGGGVDYTLAAGTLNWADGETGPKPIPVTIVEDLLPEGDQTVIVGFNTLTGGLVLGTQATTTLTIVDNDVAGSIQLSSATYSIFEAGGSVLITLTRTGGSGGVVGVTIASTDGTATTADTDYSAFPAGTTVTWGAGDSAPKTISLGIVNNSLVEGDETVNLAISTPTGGATLGGTTAAVLTILNDDTSLQLSAATYSTAETGTFVVTVTRLGTSFGAVGVSYTTGNVSALSGTDYTAASGTLAWADGDSAPKTFNVPITDDSLTEGSETLNLSLSGPTGGAILGAVGSSVLTILDDFGSLQFSSAVYSVNELLTTVTITATRTGGSGGAVSVGYSAPAGGSATGGGTDYTLAAGTLNWADQDAADKTFTVAITADALVEGNETVNLALAGPGGGATLGLAAAVLTIVDNDVTFQYSSATYNVNEPVDPPATTPLTITVTRAGTSVGAVSVSYAYTGGTAVAGADYDYPAGTLNWADGDTAPKTYVINVNADFLLEGGETIVLSLSAPTGTAAIQASLGVPASTTVTINDEDTPGTLQFTSAASSTSEGGAVVTVTASRTGGSGGIVSADYVASGSATGGGTDYTRSGTGTLTWAAGDTANKTFTVTPATDALSEGTETAIFTLQNPTNGALIGATNVHTVSILDGPGTIQYISATYTVAENVGGGLVTITVSRTGGRGGAVGVTRTTANGATNPATVAVDFTDSDGLLSWADDVDGNQTFTVPIIVDASTEGTETVALALSTPTGGATLGAQTTAVLSITDSPGVLQFSTSAFTGNEPNAATANALVTVTRTGGNGGVVGVSLSDLGGGTATSGADYNAISGVAPVSFGDGVTTSQDFTVVLNSDGAIEATKTVNLGFTTFTGGATVGAQATATLNIVDSPGSLTFSAGAYSVQEPAVSGNVIITVNRVNGSGGTVGVTYSSSDGSATQPADYTAVPGGSTLSWPAGNTTPQTFNVAIQPDAILEGDHAFNLSLSAATGGVGLGTSAAIVTIDDSPGQLQFQVTSITGNAEGAAVTVFVTRTNGSGGGASVNYAFNSSLSSAIAGDFTTAGTLTWGDLDGATKSFTVNLVDDALVESNETIVLDLTGQTGASLGAQTQISIQIVENDSALQFSQATFAGAEGSTATFQVTRTGSIAGAISVAFSVTGGGAVPADYSISTPSPLSWGVNDGVAKFISVSLVGDVSIEGTETLQLTLATPLPAATTFLGGQTIATMNIADSPGSVVFSATPYTVAENVVAGFITVTATRIGGSGGPVSATLSTIAGTALAGSDYSTVSTTVSWADGITGDFPVNIPILNDTTGENSETFSVHLSNPSPAAITLAGDQAVTVTDDDVSVRFTTTVYQGAEPGATIDVFVERVGSTTAAISVDWVLDTAAAAGRATFGAGNDYNTPTSLSTGTLNWGIAEGGNKFFQIIVLDDALGEGTETIPMSLTNVVGCTLAAPSTATFNVIDNEQTVQFTQSTYSFNENAGPVTTVEVSRTGNPAGGLTVQVNITGGSASSGSDFSAAATQNLIWIDGDPTPKTFALTILEDTSVESLETISLQIGTITGSAALGSPSTATVEIVSNDATIQFQGVSSSANEGDGTANITVTRLGDTSGTATVQYGLSGSPGTAQNTLDYTVGGTGSVTFNPTETTKTFPINIINDTAAEDPGFETVNLIVFNATGPNTQLGGPANTTLTIDDNDTVIQFEFSNYNAPEQTTPALIAIRRIGSRSGTVTVDCSTSPGAVNPATAGTDYTTTTGVVTWGNTVGGPQNFSFPIIDDLALDPNETVALTLSNLQLTGAVAGTSVSFGTPTNATATIVDDDLPGSLQFTAFGPITNEQNGSNIINVNVSRTGGTGGTVTVNYSSPAGGSATAGSDYNVLGTGTLTWNPGDPTDKIIQLEILPDSIVESNEFFDVVLSGETGGASLGIPSQITVQINDNDTGFRFTSSAQSVVENVVSATITVERVGDTTNAVQVTVGDTGTGTAIGAAVPGQDWNFGAATILNWGAGQGGTRTTSVNIFNDTMTEPSETIILNLGSQTGGTFIISPSTHTVTITNDDGPSIIATNNLALTGTSTNVSRGTNVWMRFSEAMVTGTVTATITRAGAGPVPALGYFWNSPTNTELTVGFDTSVPADGLYTLADLLALGETYTLTLVATSQGASTGITMGSNDRDIAFQTRADDSPPTLFSVSSTVGGVATGQDPRTTLLTGAVDGFNLVFSDTSGLQTTYGQAWVSTQSQEFQDMIENTGPQVDNGNPGADNMIVTWSGSTFQIRFINAVTLTPRTLYRVSVQNIQDLNSNWLNFNGFAAVTAGSEAPTTAPVISGSAPFNTQTDVSRDSGAFVGFTEPMSPNIVSVVTVTAAPGGNITALCDISYDGYSPGVDIRPLSAWPSNADITVAFGAGVTDCAGNALAATSITFHTETNTLMTPIEVDVDYSVLKPNGGGAALQVNASQNNWGGTMKFRYTLSPYPRAYPVMSSILPQHVLVAEEATGAPYKGVRIETGDRGEVRINNANTQISGDTIHVLTLTAGPLSSRGGAFVPAVHRFRTVGPPPFYTLNFPFAGPVTWSNNARPSVWNAPWTDYESSPLGTLITFDTGGSNDNTDNSNPSPFNSNWTEDVTFNASNTPGPFTLAPPIVKSTNQNMTNFNVNYGPAVTPEFTGNSGVQVMTFTLSDSNVNNTWSVKFNGYVFPTFPTPTVDTTVLGTPTRPMYNWTGVNANAEAIIVNVERVSDGALMGEWIVNRGSGGVFSSSGSFRHPADQVLTAGVQYRFMLGMFRSEDATLGDGGGFGMGEVFWTPP